MDLTCFAMQWENQHGWMVIKNQIAYLRQATVNRSRRHADTRHTL